MTSRGRRLSGTLPTPLTAIARTGQTGQTGRELLGQTTGSTGARRSSGPPRSLVPSPHSAEPLSDHGLACTRREPVRGRDSGRTRRLALCGRQHAQTSAEPRADQRDGRQRRGARCISPVAAHDGQRRDGCAGVGRAAAAAAPACVLGRWRVCAGRSVQQRRLAMTDRGRRLRRARRSSRFAAGNTHDHRHRRSRCVYRSRTRRAASVAGAAAARGCGSGDDGPARSRGGQDRCRCSSSALVLLIVHRP